MAPGKYNAIYVIVRNYDNIKQLAFTVTWDQGFTVVFANQCIPGCLDCVMFGEHELQWFVEFLDCQVGGGSVVVGQIYALPTSGCLRVSQSGYPGTITVSCDRSIEKVREENLGVVCVGPGGIDVCNEPVIVQPITWGAIKAQYK